MKDFLENTWKHMETQGTCSAGTSGIPDIAFYHVCAYGWSCDGI